MKRFAINLDVGGATWDELAANTAIAKVVSDRVLLAQGEEDIFNDDLDAIVITVENNTGTPKVKVEKWYKDGTYAMEKDR